MEELNCLDLLTCFVRPPAFWGNCAGYTLELEEAGSCAEQSGLFFFKWKWWQKPLKAQPAELVSKGQDAKVA